LLENKAVRSDRQLRECSLASGYAPLSQAVLAVFRGRGTEKGMTALKGKLSGAVL